MSETQTREYLKKQIAGLEEKVNAYSKAEQAMIKRQQQRLKFEELLTELSVVFVKIPPDQVNEKVEEVLQQIGKILGFDRIDFAQNMKGSDQLELTHSWTGEGFERYRRINSGEYYPWFTKRIKHGDTFYFTTNKLPAEAARDRESLKSMGIKSGLIMGYQLEDTRFGAICFGSHSQYRRHWIDKYARRLKLLAEVIINALFRKQTEMELRNAFKKIESLKNQLQQENIYLKEEIETIKKHDEIIGDSEGIQSVLNKILHVAKTDSTVLILGETGTGKELVARAIHRMSLRKKRTMVTVNCAALPASLIESELFGREKGAFTGALSKQIGRFEMADGATIFLDEIGELPLELQVKLLRVLQQGEFERLGSNKTIHVNTRVIAATNRDLKTEIRNGKFREDLYYRLDVYPIRVPALRDRKGDIIQLIHAFANEIGTTMGKRFGTISRTSLESAQNYSWPGNVRELRNVVERAMIACDGNTLTLKLPETEGKELSEIVTMEEHQRRYILKILKKTGWRIRGKEGTADILGMKPTTLYSRMKKLGIQRPAE